MLQWHMWAVFGKVEVVKGILKEFWPQWQLALTRVVMFVGIREGLAWGSWRSCIYTRRNDLVPMN